jgi:membrane dipeptidase
MYEYVDMHCDTLLNGVMNRSNDLYEMPGSMIDFQRMKAGHTLCQFFAVFFPPKELHEGQHTGLGLTDEELFRQASGLLNSSLNKHEDIIMPAHNYKEIMTNKSNGKMSAVLTVEDGRMVDGKMEMLDMFYSQGVRAIALTWNFSNCFGYPNSSDPEIMNKGLTKFGKEAVQYMNDLGILVDVSHLSDGGFWDVVKYTKKPFVATHSDARAVSSNQRNMTDDMIKALAEKGGVTGINFCIPFLNDTYPPHSGTSRIEDMVRMIKHISNVGGEDIVGIGTDLDGIGGDLEIGSPDKMYLLFDALEKEGFTERQIEKIASGNVLRVIKESMK